MPDCCATPKATERDARQCECHYRPNVDIYEKADQIVILADLPGATPESIELDFDDGELSIRAAVTPRQTGRTGYFIHEYGTGDYQRRFRISEVVDAEQISADFSDGVLTVRLPKVQAAKPRRITVNSG